MTENATLTGSGEAAASPLPAFLADCAPTRYRRRWAPLSPSPATLPDIYLDWESLASDPARPFGNVRVCVNSSGAIHTRTIHTFLHARDRRRMSGPTSPSSPPRQPALGARTRDTVMAALVSRQ
jgi:hypothetical protein